MNRLVGAMSPYLQQHAQNSVDWSKRGPEASEEARGRNVPVLLSVGYSSYYGFEDVLLIAEVVSVSCAQGLRRLHRGVRPLGHPRPRGGGPVRSGGRRPHAQVRLGQLPIKLADGWT
ncbi:DUF255 domain-containing protein [Streptomyces sp. NBC_00893]|uniref:DUF255 domain-containing protein n=1 Tax=Streptomyces sp. NBC_00893 TaxID=2975862 RepID=UPI00225B2B00|nr:DUF255 domain-containing protein [Streptomyces sp. NBC_00893]